MHHSASIDHARHDPTLIAGHAAGDLSDHDTEAAAALLAGCTACAELHRDLVSIAMATRALPRTARAPRDFALTAEQAERLRRGSWLRALLRPFGSSRSTVRPLAAAFTSLGVAGLLVATFVPGLLGSAASAPARDSAGSQAAAPSVAPERAGVDAAQGQSGDGTGAAAEQTNGGTIPKVAEGSGMFVAVGAGASTAADPGAEDVHLHAGEGSGAGADHLPATPATSSPTAAMPPSPVLIGSIALLVVGLAMFGLRLAARRLR